MNSRGTKKRKLDHQGERTAAEGNDDAPQRGGIRVIAGKLLGIARQTLLNKLKEYGIE